MHNLSVDIWDYYYPNKKAFKPGKIKINVPLETMLANMEYAKSLGLEEIDQVYAPVEKTAAIVGGGPSIKDELYKLEAFHGNIYACNGAYRYLLEKGIKPYGCVIADARPQNAKFVMKTDKDTAFFIASSAHKKVFDRLLRFNRKIYLWHPTIDGIETDYLTVWGGCTVGLRAMTLAFILGHRELHCYGMDSSLEESRHHVYSQQLDDYDDIIDVEVDGQLFRTTKSMLTQVHTFKDQVEQNLYEVYVHGTGLLSHFARAMNKEISQVGEP